MNRLLPVGLFLLCLYSTGVVARPVFRAAIPDRVVADTVDPVIFCPGSQLINLQPMRCDSVLFYTVNSYDDQGQVIVILLDGIASGQPFPSGPTVCTYLATDLSGNTATCSFTITMMEPMTQPFCRDTTVVNLDADCSASPHAFAVMEGGPYGCSHHYTLEVDKTTPFGNGPWADADFDGSDIGQVYQVRATALLTNTRCWGFVKIQDNRPPVVQCQNITLPCILPESQLSPSFLFDSLGISIARPTASDACGGAVAFSFIDIPENLPCGDTANLSGVIHRLWSATDIRGNTGSCMQLIRRQRQLSAVQIPAALQIACQTSDLSPTVTGRPYIQFISHRYPLSPSDYCAFSYQYSDSIVSGDCSGNYMLLRSWSITDPCSPGPKTGMQIISVVDTLGPKINCPATGLITVADVNCRAGVDLPDIPLTDNCSALTQVEVGWTDNGMSKTLVGTIDTIGGDTVAVFSVSADFPLGTRTLTYRAFDACGNSSACSLALSVTNALPPLAKCDSLLLVGLPANGNLALPASVLDNGSTDDCTPLSFKARLLDVNTCHTQALLTDTLKLCCHNLGDTLAGVLRVYDVPVPPGPVGNSVGTGHFAECQFKVRVSGSNAPTCTAPPDITVTCAQFDPSLETYGGLASQSCSVDSVATSLNTTNFDTLCHRGTIVRTFKVFSNLGQMGQCSHKIVVNYEQDYFIRFPDDAIVTACDSTGLYGSPVFYGNDCERMSVTYEDQRFTIVPDACLKIERTWKIINTCSFNPNLPLVNVANPTPNPTANHPDNLPGPVVSNISTQGDPWQSTIVKLNPTDPVPTNYSLYYNPQSNGYQYKQIIKIIDQQDPVAINCPTEVVSIPDISTNDPALWNAPYWLDPVLVSSDLCETPAALSITAGDACSGSEVTIHYQLLLDLNGDGVRETRVVSSNLPPSNTIYYNNAGGGLGAARQFDFRQVPANQKWRFAKEETVSGTQKTATVRFNTDSSPDTYAAPQLPYGSHKIKWEITDNCGNASSCEYTFVIQDGKPPVVFCKSGITVSILPDRYIDLGATDILQFSEDNCTPNQYLEYGIQQAGAGTGFPLDGSSEPIEFVRFDCDDIGPQPVELWCRDKAGNAAFCSTTVSVLDNSGNCNVQLEPLDGFVRTEDQKGIGNVTVRLEIPNGQFMPPTVITTTTDTLGYYTFGTQYSNLPSGPVLVPDYDVNPLNGLTTFDLVIISKHNLGIEPLNSPYKHIAADANKSNTITTFDIVELRKLLLGIYEELPFNTSWRFIDASYVFPNPLAPLSNNLPSTISAYQVQLKQNPGNFIGVKIGDVNNSVVAHALAPDDRSAGTLHFDLKGKEELQAGEEFEIGLQAAEWMQGCQMTLDYEGLEITAIKPGADMGQEHFALFPDKKALTMVWEKEGRPNFSLRCKAKESGNIREMLRIGSRITRAAAYRAGEDNRVDRYEPTLRFPALSRFELYQNKPNPFSDDTHISFNLPEAGDVNLKVFDTEGRVLLEQTEYFESGTHSIRLDKKSLNGAGVLYYQLQTPTDGAIRKMMKLR